MIPNRPLNPDNPPVRAEPLRTPNVSQPEIPSAPLTGATETDLRTKIAAAPAPVAPGTKDGDPRVGMIVLYSDPHGAPAVPAIVTAANLDGSFDVTVFAPAVVPHKKIKVGLGLGQIAPVPDVKPFVIAKPVPGVPVAAAPATPVVPAAPGAVPTNKAAVVPAKA